MNFNNNAFYLIFSHEVHCSLSYVNVTLYVSALIVVELHLDMMIVDIVDVVVLHIEFDVLGMVVLDIVVVAVLEVVEKMGHTGLVCMLRMDSYLPFRQPVAWTVATDRIVSPAVQNLEMGLEVHQLGQHSADKEVLRWLVFDKVLPCNPLVV